MRLLILILFLLGGPALACGTDSDCAVGDRTYRIALPEGHEAGQPIGALIWSHGYRGSAAGVMRNGALRRVAAEAGLALIAAQGVRGTWDLPRGPRTFDSTGKAEMAYFEAVVADAVTRHGIDRDRLVAAGFSAGGMMVWELACQRPEMFAGFIPFSGTFWLEPPETCARPAASIVHIHGDADRTVPLLGRPIGETKQGEVPEVLAFYRQIGGFGEPTAGGAGDLACQNRTNGAGKVLEFCLFPGGHSFSTRHLAYGLSRLPI
ncbi:MAG: prolyl oligopeptidase family serine peptidase [Sulfitobacter sp.]|nr:prolyl oligopeptidase family serine peptidase [Sulfitobacter sp.]